MKQQPGWKEVYEKMPANDKVAFAEVNCRESRELMQKHKVLLIFLDYCLLPSRYPYTYFDAYRPEQEAGRH